MDQQTSYDLSLNEGERYDIYTTLIFIIWLLGIIFTNKLYIKKRSKTKDFIVKSSKTYVMHNLIDFEYFK